VTMNSALDLTDNQINYGTNAGSQTLANLPFSSSQTGGSTNSYAMQLDGDDVLTINGVNDGSGNLNNAYVLANKELRLSGTLNTQDGTIENTISGLTVTTNDNGNLTLDPGANYELNLSNQTTGSSGSLLVIDRSGNVVEASGTTLSDVGGTPSSLVTNGNAVTSMEVFDGGTGSAISGTSDDATPPNVIGGHPSNNTGGKDVKGATIAGGGGNTDWPWDNEASAAWATVGGGKHNTASNSYATVSGGEDNTADGKNSTVPGGLGGAAEDDFSFVWNDGITHHSIPNSDTDGLSSSTAVDNETVAGSHTFSVSAKSGFRFITGGATSPNVTYIDSSGNLVSAGNVDLNGSNLEDSDGDLNIDAGSSNVTITGTDFYPLSDAGMQLGLSSNSWKEVYAENGVTQTSDARLKDNVSDLNDGYEKVRSMRPVSYQWADDSGSNTHLGFLAQEMAEIVPEAVDCPEKEDGYLGMNYESLIPVVVSALQEQQRITTDLEADLDAKDARIEDQQDRIKRLESRVDNKDVSLDTLREALDDKDDRIDTLEAENEQLRERNAELEDRLAAVEAELGIDASAGQQGVADD